MQQLMQPQLESLKSDNLTLSSMLQVLQDSVSCLSTQFNTLCASSQSNTKTAHDTQLNAKPQDELSIFVQRKREPRPLVPFKNYSESSDQSVVFRQAPGKHGARLKVEPMVHDFRLDSSMSQALQPFEPLWKGKPDAKSINFEIKSPARTPHKQQTKFVKPFASSESQDSKTSEDKGEHGGDLKIKDFSDFKELLKDLRLSIHLSEFSVMNEQHDCGIKQIEALISEYAELDKEICDLTQLNNQSTILNFSPIKRFNNATSVKKSQSLNLGHQPKGIYMYNLELLRKASNLHQLELKIRDLHNQPHEIEPLIAKLKKEISSRRNKFEELKEFIV